MSDKNIIDVITAKIKRADDEFDLLCGRKHILAGLSGGADSCALVFALLELREKYGYELSAVHVNHGIRGKEADDDEEFARRLCSEHNIRFYCERADVPSVCKETGLSLETAARNVRYQIFERICMEHGIECVATAHSASDNVETILFNLIRGCGLSGVCGIPAKRKLGRTDIEIVRPLLYVSRNQIEEYLEHINQDFVVDSTNLLTDCSRNFIRHKIVPEIRRINPEIEDSISNFVSNVTCDKKYLSDVADSMYTDDLSELSQMQNPIISRIIQRMYGEQNCGEMLESVHLNAAINEIDACVKGTKVRSAVSLPSGKRFSIENGRIKICADTREKHTKPHEYDIVLEKGINVISDTEYLVVLSDECSKTENTFEHNGICYYRLEEICLYLDDTDCVLHARNRHDGDTFFFKGMNRKVKKLLSDYEVQVGIRNSIPFVTENESIAYIPYVGVGDRYADGKSTKHNVLTVAVYMTRK